MEYAHALNRIEDEHSSLLAPIRAAMGDDLYEKLRTTLVGRWEKEVVSIGIKVRLRFPMNPEARTAWAVILLKNRAGWKSTDADHARFFEAVDQPETEEAVVTAPHPPADPPDATPSKKRKPARKKSAAR